MYRLAAVARRARPRLLGFRPPRAKTTLFVTGTAGGLLATASVFRSRNIHCEYVEEQPAASSDELPLVRPNGSTHWSNIFVLLARLTELLFIFAPTGFSAILLITPLEQWFRPHWYKIFVQALIRAGPVFIKWGQWASTRYDLFDDDMCEALGTLTDQAPTHSFEDSKESIESAFMAPLDDIFQEFEEIPLASGSIAQVHLARLRDSDQKVVVKVKHPNLHHRILVDMTLLRNAADITDSMSEMLFCRVGDTVNQFKTQMQAQLDFRHEALNLRRFRRNFNGIWRSIVSFPQPVEGLVHSDILVESFEEGISVSAFLKRDEKSALHLCSDSASMSVPEQVEWWTDAKKKNRSVWNAGIVKNDYFG